MRRFANKRDISEKDIVKALRQAGCTVYLTDKPFDMLIGRRGKTFIGECKTPKKDGGFDTLTDAQDKFINEWKGGPVVILRSADDAINWLNTVGNG